MLMSCFIIEALRLVFYMLFKYLTFVHAQNYAKTLQTKSSNLEQVNKIPKVIHQIWFSKYSNMQPQHIRMKTWSQDYTSKFPHWRYHLWDESFILKSFPKFANFTPYLMEATPHGKSDIVRYELLYQFGGVYIDADVLYLSHFNRSLDFLLDASKQTGAFCGHHPTVNWIASSVIGAIPQHPMLKYLVNNIENRWNKLHEKTSAAVSVGPLYLTEAYKKHKRNVTVFPFAYFYPVTWHGISDPLLHTRIQLLNHSLTFHYGMSTNKKRNEEK